ncbi:hypothetical protein LTR62_003073 [Meristemomyces frigidus]|uniref:Uncharacterized protein n=1 Tax=Meristemomyces frigidus TaxID=1508187 RepID=A0AAN7YH76_9PEZI|nr:hypothetical protein LTR62_003073 [Meristemomyces frigidus]
MTNHLVGDVYLKIIQSVIQESKAEFEENGVNQTTLADLEKEWKAKLTGKNVALMPWDPKPEPVPVPQAQPQAPTLPSVAATNGLPLPYSGYNQQPTQNGGARIKTEPAYEQQYNGPPPGYGQQEQQPGGQARAAVLAQEYVQQRGLALPGQRPQAMQDGTQPTPQQQHALFQQRQRMAMQQQQSQPRIKVENHDSAQLNQGQFQQQQRPPHPTYAQTDGGNLALSEWQAHMAERRAITAEAAQRADRMMQERIEQHSADLQSGLMMTLDEQPKSTRYRKQSTKASSSAQGGRSLPQYDGAKEEDEDEKKPIKDEADEDAINSDLDSDEDPTGDINDDDDDAGDTILCTYDKVQRVKNKWKCTLKDGVMSINKKEWVFHKGQGEFEW